MRATHTSYRTCAKTCLVNAFGGTRQIHDVFKKCHTNQILQNVVVGFSTRGHFILRLGSSKPEA